MALLLNAMHDVNIEALFEFACAYLIDDGSLLLFVPKKKNVREDVRTFAASYDFVLRKNWWGFNEFAFVLST
jgi:hypothetical protein